jgi:hypothetical protein
MMFLSKFCNRLYEPGVDDKAVKAQGFWRNFQTAHRVRRLTRLLNSKI